MAVCSFVILKGFFYFFSIFKVLRVLLRFFCSTIFKANFPGFSFLLNVWFQNDIEIIVFFFSFNRSKDSLFTLATSLRTHEFDTFSTKCLTDRSPNIVKNEPQEQEDHNCNNSEENNSYSCKTENSSCSSPKRPGWFGKGYAKVKKSSKKRRLRWWILAVCDHRIQNINYYCYKSRCIDEQQ